MIPDTAADAGHLPQYIIYIQHYYVEYKYFNDYSDSFMGDVCYMIIQ